MTGWVWREVPTVRTSDWLGMKRGTNCENKVMDLHVSSTYQVLVSVVWPQYGYFRYPQHEKLVYRIAEEIGFHQVSLSSVVMPMVRAVPRGHTACADAYLTPHIRRYVKGMYADHSNKSILWRKDSHQINFLFWFLIWHWPKALCFPALVLMLLEIR